MTNTTSQFRSITMYGWKRHNKNKHTSNADVQFTFVTYGDFTELHNRAFAFAKQHHPKLQFVWSDAAERDAGIELIVSKNGERFIAYDGATFSDSHLDPVGIGDDAVQAIINFKAQVTPARMALVKDWVENVL